MARIYRLSCICVLFFAAGTASVWAGQAAPRSPRKATVLSAVSTAVPLIAGSVIYFGFSDRFENWDDGGSIAAASVGAAGLIFGPGVGHGYAGNSGKLVKGALIRGALLGMIPAGVAIRRANSGQESVGPAIALLIAPAAISATYDIATASRSAEEHNREQIVGQLSVSPAVLTPEGRLGWRAGFSF